MYDSGIAELIAGYVHDLPQSAEDVAFEMFKAAATDPKTFPRVSQDKFNDALSLKILFAFKVQLFRLRKCIEDDLKGDLEEVLELYNFLAFSTREEAKTFLSSQIPKK